MDDFYTYTVPAEVGQLATKRRKIVKKKKSAQEDVDDGGEVSILSERGRKKAKGKSENILDSDDEIMAGPSKGARRRLKSGQTPFMLPDTDDEMEMKPKLKRLHNVASLSTSIIGKGRSKLSHKKTKNDCI